MRSGVNWLLVWWATPLLAFLTCFSLSWLMLRCEIWLSTLFGYESGPKIVSQPAARLSVAFQPQCNGLFWLKAADIKPFLTRGGNFKSWRWLCGLFPADLRHHRRDVHGRRNHWLLYIHRFRGLEEDPDWKNVLRTAPHPSSHLIYKCKVASPLAKSDPHSHRPPFGDCITVTSEAILALHLTTGLRLSYFRSSQAP